MGILVSSSIFILNDDKYNVNADSYWAVYLKYTQNKSCNFTCSLMINGLEYLTDIK